MVNKVRGDVSIGGRAVALTLSALAEIEDEFGVESFEEAFKDVFSGRLSARPTMRFLTAVLRGNGMSGPDAKTAAAGLGITEALAAVNDLVDRSGLLPGDGEGTPAGAVPLPQGETAGVSG